MWSFIFTPRTHSGKHYTKAKKFNFPGNTFLLQRPQVWNLFPWYAACLFYCEDAVHGSTYLVESKGTQARLTFAKNNCCLNLMSRLSVVGRSIIVVVRICFCWPHTLKSLKGFALFVRLYACIETSQQLAIDTHYEKTMQCFITKKHKSQQVSNKQTSRLVLYFCRTLGKCHYNYLVKY